MQSRPNLTVPSGIAVFALETVVGAAYPTATNTGLFRQNIDLPGALNDVINRYEGSRELRIISAACSLGAEAMSAVALLNHLGFAGRLALQGVDSNPHVVDAAQKGSYVASFFSGSDHLETAKQQLIGLDFTVAEEYESEHRTTVSIGTEKVRKGNAIDFRVADLTRPSGLIDQVDLIMFNNAAFHLSSRRARRVADYLGSRLAPSGVLSIAGNGGPDQPMRGPFPSYEPYYSDWIQDTTQLLAENHGLQPIAHDEDGLAIRFARAT
jgi:chemotaxis methyl-accepting protein methylase